MEEDRVHMQDVISEMSGHIKVLTENLQEYMNRNTTLESELNETRSLYNQAVVDIQKKEDRIRVVLYEYDVVKVENKSLRESCQVLELENKDLAASETKLKYMMSRPQTLRDQEPHPQSGSDVVTLSSVHEGLDDAADGVTDDEPLASTIRPSEYPQLDGMSVNDVNSVTEEEDGQEEEAHRVQDRVAKSRLQRVLDGPTPEETLVMLLENIQVVVPQAGVSCRVSF
jgi:chromosome segregation ATPase